MHREGHIGVNFVLYSPIAFLLMEYDMTVVFGLGLVGIGAWAFLPDVDMALPIPHRGPTHSIPAAIVAGLITAAVAVYLASTGIGSRSAFVIDWWVLSYLAAAGFGFGIGFLGVIGHLLGDVLTPMGVKPWWPYSNRKYSLTMVLAADKKANQQLSMAGALAVTASLVLATIN